MPSHSQETYQNPLPQVKEKSWGTDDNHLNRYHMYMYVYNEAIGIGIREAVFVSHKIASNPACRRDAHGVKVSELHTKQSPA